MATMFGKRLRIIRIQHDEVLKDTAALLGVSSAFLSAVENGKRTVPAGWCEKIARHYSLTAEECNELKSLAAQSAPLITLRLSGEPAAKRDVANVFAAAFERMSESDARQLMDYLQKSNHHSHSCLQKGYDGQIAVRPSYHANR